MERVQVLSIPASAARPFDSLTEGTVVSRVDARNLLGHEGREPVVTLTCVPARLVVVDVVHGQHVHNLDHGSAQTVEFHADEMVSVLRPGPVEPCVCGAL